MAKTKHGLPETKGQFKLRGLATGLHRDKAFQDKTTKTNRQMHILNFGVETSPESTTYVTIQGMEQDKVYYGKRNQDNTFTTQSVDWDRRDVPPGDGFNLIGVSIGLEQGEDGKNIVETEVDFDAAKTVYGKLSDQDPLFVRGNIEFSSFKRDNGEVSRNTKFNVQNIYGSKDIDFEAEDFNEVSDFKQKIVFMGIEKFDGDDGDTKFIVDAKVVGYGSIENTELIIYNKALANTFKTQLKPYTAIDVWGDIFNKVEVEETNEGAAAWGEDDSFKTVNRNYIRELVITGADPESIDKETYTEESIQKAIEKLNSTGQVNKNKSNGKSGDDWGNNDASDIDNDDLPW